MKIIGFDPAASEELTLRELQHFDLHQREYILEKHCKCGCEYRISFSVTDHELVSEPYNPDGGSQIFRDRFREASKTIKSWLSKDRHGDQR